MFQNDKKKLDHKKIKIKEENKNTCEILKQKKKNYCVLNVGVI